MCIVQVPWLDSADNDSLFICIPCLSIVLRHVPHRIVLLPRASDTHRPPDPAARHVKHPDRMHVPNPTPGSPLHETIKYLARPSPQRLQCEGLIG